MNRARLNLFGATALALTLSLSVAQAEPPATPGNAGGAQINGGAQITGGAQINKGGPSGGGLMNDGGPNLGAKGGANAGAEVDVDTSVDGAEGKGSGKAGANTEEGKAGKSAKGDTDMTTEGKAGANAEGQADMKGKTGATAEGQAKTEGKAGGKTKLGSQDVSKVRSYFHTHKPQAHRIETSEVNVSIGIAIPGAIVLYDLPPDVIVVEGACPVKYFVWGDDVVIVDSCSRQVIEIIVDVA